MNTHTNLTHWIAGGLIAAVVLTAASPAAAGHRHRYKRVASAPVQPVVIHHHSSSVAPVFAGIVGGFILGAAVANAQPVVVHERVVTRPVTVYRYYDPYADLWFDSLDDCETRHYRGHRRVVHVIDTRSGHHVRTLRWTGGAWVRVESAHVARHFDGDDD